MVLITGLFAILVGGFPQHFGTTKDGAPGGGIEVTKKWPWLLRVQTLIEALSVDDSGFLVTYILYCF